MDADHALRAFSALADGTRLRVIHALVVAGPEGMAAGAVAQDVGASPSRMSFHLTALAEAGLVRSRREAKSIIYSADFDALSGIIQFLMRDCCGGRPEICDPAMAVLSACCSPSMAATPRTGTVA